MKQCDAKQERFQSFCAGMGELLGLALNWLTPSQV
jgi:hypothetical protein